MMKCNILAIIIPVLLAGTTNAAEIYNKDGNKLNLYGKVNAHHFIINKSDVQQGDDTSSNLGVSGTTKISDRLSGFADIELESISNKNFHTDYKTKIAFAGLKFTDFNSLDYGRNYGILYDINSWTDVLPLYGADSMSQSDNYLTGRSNNLLTYRNTNFFGFIDGFNFALQYQGKNTEIAPQQYDVNSNLKTNGSGFGVSANYNLGWGITLGGSYDKSNRYLVPTINNKNNKEPNNKDKSTKYAEGWNAGIKYDANNLYLAAMYGKTNYMTRFGLGVEQNNISLMHIANKAEHIELVVQYLMDEIGLKPSIGYVYVKGKNLTDLVTGFDSEDQNLMKYSSLGAFYYFNKNLTGIIDYKINLLHANNFVKKYNLSRENVFGLGLVYKF